MSIDPTTASDSVADGARTRLNTCQQCGMPRGLPALPSDTAGRCRNCGAIDDSLTGLAAFGTGIWLDRSAATSHHCDPALHWSLVISGTGCTSNLLRGLCAPIRPHDQAHRQIAPLEGSGALRAYHGQRGAS